MEFAIFLRRVRDEAFPLATVQAHVDALDALDREGRLIAAGPLRDDSGGLVLARFDSREEAERYARTDPFVAEGYETAEVHEWVHAHRGNGYLLG